jgi:transcription initiation factor TFIID subunit 1, fungi type
LLQRRKIDGDRFAVKLPIFRDDIPSLDDPVTSTRKLAKRAILDLNDPELLVDEHPPNAGEKKKRKHPADDFRKDISGSLAKKLARRYNFSNDHAYDQLKENHQHKVRSTLGNLNIEHAGPAIRLQYPFYKVSLSAREARSFHRPTINFMPNQTVTFGRLEHKKRKTFKGRDPQDIFAQSKDLTLGDNSNMTLFEYSEEYPTMMSNFGMGSKLINYYRRKDEEDTARPKYDLGETQVLLPQDKSPFAIFGSVEPGTTVPTLQNALYRAPVFKHEPKGTDFLVGRSSTGIHGQKWYIRNIENLFVVGQEFPSVEVPGTHARKVTETAKKRLKMYSFRIYEKYINKQGPPLRNDQILVHLPGTDVSANRTKMREFMVYDRERSQWELYPNTVLPDEATMRSWIKPEDLCQIEATQVGERHLMDFGYNKGSTDIQDVSQDDKSGVGLEHQLAPWNTTKSFLQAAHGKAMLELHGEGDPSGRGEAFSMIKTSMKGGFQAIGESVEDQLRQKQLREQTGHQYNVSQQWDSYHAAIKKIWNAQTQSLSSTLEHSDTEMDVDDEEPGEASFTRGQTPRSEYGTPAHGHRDDETTSQFSRFSSNSQKGKILKITRQVPDKHGNLQPIERIITDPKVMREYIRRRRAQDLSRLALEDLKPTGNAEIDARQRKMLEEELARLHRNKERRHVREKAKGIFDPDGDSVGGGKGVGTQRRCANCGQVGHIKTNKKYSNPFPVFYLICGHWLTSFLL